MKRFLLFLLRGYKKRISPALGTNCRFTPSCSSYTMSAIEIHGSLKGSVLGFWRILRCNPLGKVGYDPPPERGMWKNPNRMLYKESKKKQGN